MCGKGDIILKAHSTHTQDNWGHMQKITKNTHAELWTCIYRQILNCCDNCDSWFHLNCVGLEDVPDKINWLYMNCHNIPQWNPLKSLNDYNKKIYIISKYEIISKTECSKGKVQQGQKDTKEGQIHLDIIY